MTEDELLESVLELSALLGAKVMHIRPARTKKGWRTPVQGDGKGWPDLTIVTKDGRLLFRELKSARGRLSFEQGMWLRWLIRCGQDCAVWTPKDWPDRIRAELEPRKAGA